MKESKSDRVSQIIQDTGMLKSSFPSTAIEYNDLDDFIE